jgi:RimJ/RimL family protein N-acetyltransferase
MDDTQNLYNLREVEDDDHEWLVELHNDPLVLRNITHPYPITLESHMKWWKSLNQQKEMRLIFTVNGERAGFCKFYDIDKENESCILGADIHASHRGKGYANVMWRLMLDVCFSNMALHRASLTVADFNEVGKRVYKKVGFIEEGRLHDSLFRDGKFHDQIMMYKLNEMYKLDDGNAK